VRSYAYFHLESWKRKQTVGHYSSVFSAAKSEEDLHEGLNQQELNDFFLELED